MKIIILDYSDGSVHIFTTEKDIIDMEDFLNSKGFKDSECSYMMMPIDQKLSINYH